MSEEKNRKEARLAALRAYMGALYDGGEMLRYDCLSRKVQVTSPDPSSERGGWIWRDLTDFDINTIAIHCAQDTGRNITPQDVNTVLHSDFVPIVHPLRDYLDRCPEYDARKMPDWIDQLAQQVTVKLHVGSDPTCSSELWRRCFKKWFVGMVASWMNDDIVNHQVLVLIGRQGIYKTTWLEHLLPPELRSYVTKLASSRELGKDDRIRVAEFGLINMDEIDSMSPREINVLKSVITTTDVNERAAYGITKERRIRCASFCASGNNRQFLTDDTGNRRWLPFEVESIESPWDRTEPWAYIYGQAKYLIEMGFAYWFDMEENEHMETYKKEFEAPRSEEELLLAYFRPARPEDAANAHFYSSAEIHGRLKNWGNIERPMPLNKFGELLRAKGFEQKRPKGRRGYLVVELSTTMDSNQMARELLSQAECQ